MEQNTNSQLESNNFNNEYYWNEYMNNLEYRMNNMWNLVLYNQFTNERVEKLQEEIKRLNNNLTNLREKNNKLYDDNRRMDNQIYCYRNDIADLKKKLEPKKEEKKPIKRRRETDEDKIWFNRIKRKRPRDYEYMKKESCERELLDHFSKLGSIDDIIKLKDSEKLYDYLKIPKFNKIYQLIPALERLNKMVGMGGIKDQVFSMICYCLHQMNSDEDLNHMVIMGPPGVGKTTLAQLLGDIYRNLGFLSNNTFIRARRSDLIAQYLGQTAVKTQKLIDKAEGGVLFIDEVYSLGNPQKRDSFAKECIDTINQNLTEKSKNLLVIVAGYEKEVKDCFFSYNPGLERRFPLQFKIDKYNAEELLQILQKIVNLENWSLKENLVKYLEKEIKDNYKLFNYMGGDMQTLFKFSKENYSRRLMKTVLTLDSPKELVIDDFKYAINRFKDNRKKEEIPYYARGMYI